MADGLTAQLPLVAELYILLVSCKCCLVQDLFGRPGGNQSGHCWCHNTDTTRNTFLPFHVEELNCYLRALSVKYVMPGSKNVTLIVNRLHVQGHMLENEEGHMGAM